MAVCVLDDGWTNTGDVEVSIEWAFTRRAKESGLLTSMGSIGDCFENAMVESFLARIQVELLNRKRSKTRVEPANPIFEYLEIFHNRQRRHSSLGMHTPTEYETIHRNQPAARLIQVS